MPRAPKGANSSAASGYELDFKSTRSLRDTLLPTTGPPWLSSMSTT